MVKAIVLELLLLLLLVAVEAAVVDLLAVLLILQARNKKNKYIFMLNIVYNTIPLLGGLNRTA